jgi:hypothetical protein
MGVPLNNLTDLFRATSQAVLTGDNMMLHEAVKQTTLLRKILKVHDMTDLVQSGDSITDQIILEEDSTASDYEPMDSFTPRLQNHLTEISIGWRFTQINVTFSKHEKGLQGASNLKRGARAMVFKRIIKAKWTNLFVSLVNHLERQFFATPSNATMEASGGKIPMSLFCTVTENGAVYTDQSPTGIAPSGFTTVQAVNPTTNTRWRNPVEVYADGVTEIETAGNRWDGFRGMRRLVERMNWEPMAIRPEHGEVHDPTDNGFIICSLRGKDLWEHAQSRVNDHTRMGPQNAAYSGPGSGGGLNFDGIPVCFIKQMDHAAGYRSAVAGTSDCGEFNSSTDDAGGALTNPEFEGPRYIMIQPKYWKKIMHGEHWLEEEAPPATVFQPFSRTIYYDCWHNNWNASRQRAAGILTPSAPIDV